MINCVQRLDFYKIVWKCRILRRIDCFLKNYWRKSIFLLQNVFELKKILGTHFGRLSCIENGQRFKKIRTNHVILSIGFECYLLWSKATWNFKVMAIEGWRGTKKGIQSFENKTINFLLKTIWKVFKDSISDYLQMFCCCSPKLFSTAMFEHSNKL